MLVELQVVQSMTVNVPTEEWRRWMAECKTNNGESPFTIVTTEVGDAISHGSDIRWPHAMELQTVKAVGFTNEFGDGGSIDPSIVNGGWGV